jgi:hypothetical protein
MIRMYGTKRDEKGRFTPIKMLFIVVIMVFVAFLCDFKAEPKIACEKIQEPNHINQEKVQGYFTSSSF